MSKREITKEEKCANKKFKLDFYKEKNTVVFVKLLNGTFLVGNVTKTFPDYFLLLTKHKQLMPFEYLDIERVDPYIENKKELDMELKNDKK